jgi:hypothetical protein
MEDRANIEKKAVFRSPSQFYVNLRGKEDTVRSSKILTNFRDLMFAATEGCPCDSEMNLQTALTYYNRLKEVDTHTKDSYLGQIGVTKVVFYDMDGKEVATWSVSGNLS